MRYNRFGNTDLRVSCLGFGAFGVAGSDQGGKVLDLLMEGGVNFIDTAHIYPGSEEFLGNHLKGRRANLVLSTKIGEHEILPDGTMRSKPVGEADVDLALRRLRTDFIDIMMLHSYDLDKLRSGEAVETLRRAQQKGKIRYFGYSGDNKRAEYALTIPGLSALEASANLVDQGFRRLLPGVRKAGAGLIAKRPIANACWKFSQPSSDNSLAAPPSIPEGVREYHLRFQNLKIDPKEFGCEYWDELFLRFPLSMPEISTAIVGTGSLERARRNLEIAQKPLLNELQLAKTESLFRELEQSLGKRLEAMN